jgi:hypothetical protein
LVKDSLADNKDEQAFRRIQLRMETEKHLSDIDKLESQASASALKRNAVIAVLILVLVVFSLAYSRYRLKANNNAGILKAEKLRAEEKLKNAGQLLQNFTKRDKKMN